MKATVMHQGHPKVKVRLRGRETLRELAKDKTSLREAQGAIPMASVPGLRAPAQQEAWKAWQASMAA
jgi:hypothetical protein